MLVAVVIAAALGLLVFRDAKLLEAQGSAVGNTPAGAWGIGTFLFAIVFGPLYLWQRSKLRPGADRSCPSCRAALAGPARYCPSCGCPLRIDVDRNP